MSKGMPIFLRAHTEILKNPKAKVTPPKTDKTDTASNQKRQSPKWAEYVLAVDCESTIDPCQTLTFGSYRFCRANSEGRYSCIEEGLFHPDDLSQTDLQGFSLLVSYAATAEAQTEGNVPTSLRLLSRSKFMEEVFWKAAMYSDASIVGFSLPFDTTRLALDNKEARSRNERWSLVMFQDTDPESGQPREHPFRPRIILTPKDSKAAFIRFAGISQRSKKTKERLFPYTPGRFLDLRTFGWALRNESYSLERAHKAFLGVPGKLDHKPTGKITTEEIDYCRQDVRVTVSLLNAMRKDFDRHPIDLRPENAYSPASIAKAYLKAMGVTPPSKKFNVSGQVLGAAMQGYYGGRAEARIRRTFVPTVLTDFKSEYATVNTLMGLWSFLTAANLKIEEATDSVRTMLKDSTVEAAFEPTFWKSLPFFALIQPKGDVLPVRTSYSGHISNIGINPLTSQEPIWFAGPDVVSATLLTGRPPRILRAFRVIPEGQQEGLKTVSLRGMIEIDPRRDDFFKSVVEARGRVGKDSSLPLEEREALEYFLKILASAGSYGLFVEVNPERVGTDSKTGKPARAKLQVFSGEQSFEQTSPVIEESGVWYCPLFAALITAGGRLLLALLEQIVVDAGGSYLFCDTDSMAIVSSKDGGFVPCVGGPYELSDGQEAIKVLPWAEVERFVHKFERLNPYDRQDVTDPILKVEKVNFGPDGKQRDIGGYAIAAKRYALYTRDGDCGNQSLQG